MIAINQNLTAYVIDSLNNLTPGELHKLERAITPDIAFLLTKAFGPEMGILTWPLIANDEQDDNGTETYAPCNQDCACTSGPVHNS